MHREYWQNRCRRLALTLLLGRIGEAVGPVLLGVAAVATCLVLLARLRVLPGTAGSPGIVAGLAGVAIAVAVVVGLIRGRPRDGEIRLRLEEALGLQNRLSAAAEGAVDWPPPPAGAAADRPVVRWRWRQVLALPFLSVALVLLAAWLPVKSGGTTTVAPVQKPPALQRLEEITGQLLRSETVDERALADLREKVEQLANREPEGWYAHAALEAAESLLRQTETGLAELAGNFALAARMLDQAAAAGRGNGHDVETPDGLGAALHGLEHGGLPAAGRLVQMLRDTAGRPLDPETVKKLSDRLRSSADLCSGLGGPEGYMVKHFPRLGPGSTPGSPFGEGGAEGTLGLGSGFGEPIRGPGTVPLALAAEGSTAQPGLSEALEGFDPDRAALGEIAGQSIGRHEIDRSVTGGPDEGGTLTAPGTGGDAAWTQRLTPAEQRAVQRTFQ